MVLYVCEDQEDLFFKLSVHGIIALFSCDKLLITHENEVLRLLIAWVTKTQCDDNNTEELKCLLRHSVRVCHLDMTIINELVHRLDWFELSDIERSIACAYSNHAKHTQISSCIETPEKMPAIWFKKREYRLNEPSSFSLSTIIIHHNENGGTSEVTSWHGYDVMCDVDITMSNTIKGTVFVSFPEKDDDVALVFVLVIYNVTING